MTRGISEQNVFEAADKLLARGERPTIERVRLELGRGSPNTVNRMLDGWWSGLAGRIAAKEASKLPAQFQAACERMYEKVVSDCRSQAELSITTRLEAIEAQERKARAKQEELSAHENVLSVPIGMLRADLAKANELVVELTSKNGVLLQEVEALKRHNQELRTQVAEEQLGLTALSERSQTELARVRAQWEAQENRWLRQIDALREDLKLSRSDRTAEKREASKAISLLEGTVARLQKQIAAKDRSSRTLNKSKSVNVKKALRQKSVSFTPQLRK